MKNVLKNPLAGMGMNEPERPLWKLAGIDSF